MLLVLVGVVLGAGAFLGLGSEVREGETQAFDVGALRSLRRPEDLTTPIGPAWLSEAARDVTALGGVSVLTGASLAVAGFLLLRRNLRAVVFLGVSLLGGTCLSILLKGFYHRARPSAVPHLTGFDSASFPSGHSLLSAVTYLTLGVVLARLAGDRASRIYFLTVALALTFVVGASRVYLGFHYPTDVLAGWAAGIAWALLCSLVARYLQHRGTVEPPGSVGGATPPGERAT